MRLQAVPQSPRITWVVWAIGAHSAVLGIGLVIAADTILAAFGWQPTCDSFFFHQVGVFHIILGAAYVWDYLRSRSVVLVVGAKLTAVVFLGLECLLGPCLLGPMLALVADGTMAAVVLALVWWES
jgi:hypothetical protein